VYAAAWDGMLGLRGLRGRDERFMRSGERGRETKGHRTALGRCEILHPGSIAAMRSSA